MSDVALRSAIRLRLGLPPVLHDVSDRCAQCDTVVPRPLVHFHPFSCSTRRSGQNLRHTLVRDALVKIARSAGLIASTDQLALTVPVQRGGSPLIADALITGPQLSRMIDVSVVCSCAPSYRDRCVRKPNSALSQRAALKVDKYTASVSLLGHSFAPLVMDALGVPHRGVTTLLDDIAARAASAGIIIDANRKTFTKSALSQLAFAVLEGNLTIFHDCWPLVGPHAAGAGSASPASLAAGGSAATPLTPVALSIEISTPSSLSDADAADDAVDILDYPAPPGFAFDSEDDDDFHDDCDGSSSAVVVVVPAAAASSV